MGVLHCIRFLLCSLVPFVIVKSVLFMVSKAISYHKIPLTSLSNNSCGFGSEIPTTFVQPQVKVIDPEFAIFGPPGLDAWWAQGG